MPGYSAPGSQNAASTTPISIVSVEGGTNIRPKLFYVVCGAIADAANSALLAIKRQTASGTGTAVTPEPLDEDAVAAVSTAEQNHTVEPTYGSVILIPIPLHQRNTFQWVAIPDKGEIIAGKTAEHGFGLQIVTIENSGTALYHGALHFTE